MSKKIKVLIVDDSAVVRQVLTATLGKDAEIEIIGSASDPLFAMERMKREWPDVIVLDVEMPRMDGISFLRKLMADRPTPVVVCSTLTVAGAETTVQALAAGAVSVVSKAKVGVKSFLEDQAHDIAAAVKAAARANVRRLHAPTAPAPVEVPRSAALAQTTERVIAIGTSTGGTQALEQILRALPRTSPGIVIVQHMPEHFTAAFAARLNAICEIEVREAQPNDRVLPGRALIAPGGRHMALKRSGAQYCVEVVDGPLVNRHKPSVDVLFRSVARVAAKNAVGFILTGMGDDGARGLKEMHDVGAYTIAQDEESCVVYGMPKEAVKLEAVDRILSLDRIAAEIMRHR